MIIEEIRNLLRDPSDDGERLNEIVDEFRRGRNPEEILDLLDCQDGNLISIGAWILGELPLKIYIGVPFILRLEHLTSHEDPIVRFNSLGALYPALDGASARTKSCWSGCPRTRMRVFPFRPAPLSKELSNGDLLWPAHQPPNTARCPSLNCRSQL
jgi:hypothetical protein